MKAGAVRRSARGKATGAQNAGLSEAKFVLTTPGQMAAGPGKSRGRKAARGSTASPTKMAQSRFTKGTANNNSPAFSLAKDALPKASSDFSSPRSESRESAHRLDEEEESSQGVHSGGEEPLLEDEYEDEEQESENKESEKEEEEERRQEPMGGYGAAPSQKRKRVQHPPLRIDVASKIQRLRTDPHFSRIRSETLGRVIDQFENDASTPSVIVNTTVHKPVARRSAVRWDAEEIGMLERGFAKHGSSWSRILADPDLKFKDRTQVDLKDKYRNLHNYRMYAELPIRRFVLVNENHEPVLTDRGGYRHFKNRWPADAALKVATKDFVYAPGAETARIFLRELLTEGKEGMPEVHVFEVSRRREELLHDVPRSHGSHGIHVGIARKICTECLITREAVLADFDVERV